MLKKPNAQVVLILLIAHPFRYAAGPANPSSQNAACEEIALGANLGRRRGARRLPGELGLSTDQERMCRTTGRRRQL
jgi:hypothetical protein